MLLRQRASGVSAVVATATVAAPVDLTVRDSVTVGRVPARVGPDGRGRAVPTTGEGVYDLPGSIDCDVNGEGDITSGDPGLILVTEAITVSPDLFSHGFESGTQTASSATGS